MKIKKILVALLCITMLTALLVPAVGAINNNYDFKYKGAEVGDTINGKTVAVMEINNSTTSYKTYCADNTNKISKDDFYSLNTIEESGKFTPEVMGKIRAIISNSYPYIDLAELSKRSGITVTSKEAMDATQEAIWKYTNNSDDSNYLSSNVKSLYNWYLALEGITGSKTTLDTKKIVEANGDKVTVTLYARGVKDSAVTADSLSFVFNKDLVKEYGATVSEKTTDSEGYQIVKVENLPKNSNFECSIEGIVEDFDVLYFSSKLTKQPLISAKDPWEKTKLSFNGEEYNDIGLKIKKIDSVSGEAIEGVVFEISKTKDFSKIEFTMTTDKNGIAIKKNISAGTYWVREKEAPEGYIKYTDVFPLSVGFGLTYAEMKNTPFGKIDIMKIDENKNPVVGAEFSIYEGEKVDESKLIAKGLVSGSDGHILVPNLMAGKYTVVETKCPDGYHIDQTPQTVEVLFGKTTKVTFINETVKNGELDIIKKDAVSMEQLGGGKYAIYTDEACTNKVAEVTSLKDKPAKVENLKPGTYWVKELKAPDGYLNDASTQKVELAEGATALVTFYNHRPPVTAGNFGAILLSGIGILVVGAGIFFATKRIKSK